MARLAAENISRADYAERLSGCLKRLRAHMVAGSVEASSEVRQEFHDLLYEIAGNDMLKEAGHRYTYPLQRQYFNELAGKTRTEDSLREHEDIIQAVLAGDGTRAERMLRIHLRNRASAVCEVLDELNQRNSDVA